MPPTSSAPEPSGATPLTVFTDRSLGGVVVPRVLRAAGLQVVTMAEHYGRERAQLVADVDWIAETSQRGWLAFHLDARIRRRTAEAAVVLSTGARMFCVANGNLTGAQTAERFVANLDAITEAAQESGPYVYGVYADHIERLTIYGR